DAARVDALRVKVGAAQKLPPAVADLLQGSTEQELTEHASRLLADLDAHFKQTARPRGDLDQGGRSTHASTSPREDFADFLQGQLRQ
nr:hypothetical protein [Actinomycetota bacterium]